MADYFTDTFTKEETMLGLHCCYSDTDLCVACPYDNTITDCTQLIKRDDKSIKEIKNQAYKEFAEKLKKEALTRFDWTDYIEMEDIDNVLKELIGEE